VPAIVDHAERRRHICDITAQIISRSGVEGVTIRSVAQKANWSTTRISHYFKTKQELLQQTFREFALRSLAQGEQAFESSASLQAAFEIFLPLDDERRLSWQVWLAFWGTAASDGTLLREQVLRGRQMRALIERLLIAKLGARRRGLDWDFASEHLLTVIVGIATQGVFDPARWTPRKQRRHLASELSALAAAAEPRAERGEPAGELVYMKQLLYKKRSQS
jgi:AcrR family transcriptional regulator